MAIDTTDQNTQIAAEDGGATLSADDAEIPIDEEELEAGPGAALATTQKGGGIARGKTAGGGRRERRESYQEGMRKKISDEVLGTVRNELSTFRTEFSRMLDGARQAAGGGQRQAAPQQQGPDPFEARLADIDAAREAELKLLQAHDRTKGAFDFTRYRKLENDRTALLARREAMQVLQQMGLNQQTLQQLRQGGGGQRQAYAQEAIYLSRFQRLQEEFPQLEDRAIAQQVGAYRNYLRQAGRPDTFDVDREAVLAVMAQNGIRTAPVPRGNPRLYQSPGAGARGGDKPAREIRLPAAVVNALDADERAMASKMLFADGEA